MARHKEFDPNTALMKATHLFWQKGYAATSIDDLVVATGVQRYGLYTTFGDKHALFLRTLDHYVNVMVAGLLSDVEAEGAAWSAVTDFFQTLLTISRGDQGSYGCLMCNSAIELAVHDTAVSEQMDVYLDRLHKAFANAFTNAQQNGEVGLTFSPADSATYLCGVAIGLFNLSKTNMPRQDMDTYVHVALTGLKAA